MEMYKRKTSLKHEASHTSKNQQRRPHFSKAILAIANTNLKEFTSQSDEAFLIRADINRKLSIL